MQNFAQQQNRINPLINMMRQPKIYIRLPSNGKYWPAGSLNVTENGEYPVYSMTAKDELLLKTPDALLNGQAVVEVLQSCMPNVLNGWQTPQLDVDTMLIAIRLATYGQFMDTNITVKGCDATYPVDLRNLLDQFSIIWEDEIKLRENMTAYIRPLNYKEIARASSESFETQRIINMVNDKTIDEERKLELFKTSFAKLTEITLDTVASSIYRIETPAGSVDDPVFIKEFMQNCDREVFNKVKEKLDYLKEINTLKPIKVKATPEMVEAGASEEIEVPIVFDPSTFFG